MVVRVQLILVVDNALLGVAHNAENNSSLSSLWEQALNKFLLPVVLHPSTWAIDQNDSQFPHISYGCIAYTSLETSPVYCVMHLKNPIEIVTFPYVPVDNRQKLHSYYEQYVAEWKTLAFRPDLTPSIGGTRLADGLAAAMEMFDDTQFDQSTVRHCILVASSASLLDPCTFSRSDEYYLKSIQELIEILAKKQIMLSLLSSRQIERLSQSYDQHTKIFPKSNEYQLVTDCSKFGAEASWFIRIILPASVSIPTSTAEEQPSDGYIWQGEMMLPQSESTIQRTVRVRLDILASPKRPKLKKAAFKTDRWLTMIFVKNLVDGKSNLLQQAMGHGHAVFVRSLDAEGEPYLDQFTKFLANVKMAAQVQLSPKDNMLVMQHGGRLIGLIMSST